MSRSQSAVTLPEIQTLAPIDPMSVPRQRTNESLMTSSSVTSQDTFITAFTSTNSPPTARLNTTSPHTLRKSISADSFIKNRRSPDLSEAGSSVHSREYTRDSFETDSGLDPDLEEWNAGKIHGTRGEDSRRPRAGKTLASRVLGRARGHSMSSSIVPDYDDPYLDDSEHERTSDMAYLPLLSGHCSHIASSPSVNGFGKGKTKARPGDVLLLPPRTPRVSNASSASSLSIAANSPLFNEDVPPVPPIPQLQHRRSHIPGPLIMPHRMRSGSLGANPLRNSWEVSDDFSIAVVGSAGCGKSTVIRKGLKTWGISDESACSVSTPKGRLRYGSRTIAIPLVNHATRTAHILELDSDTLHLDSPGGAWPEGLPHIDGVLVCYDASDLASFARVPELLACYHDLHLSAVVMACKCDLEKKVPPHRASDRAAPYNVGLVEVTQATDIGKKKMRSCFTWLLRAVAQAKRGDQQSGSPYRNPASPDVLISPPWADGYGYPDMRSGNIRPRVSTPSAGSPSTAIKFREHPLATSVHIPPSLPVGASTPTPRSPSAPTSPTRVKSTSDLMSEVEKSRQEERRRESLEGRGGVIGPLGRPVSMSVGSLHETHETLVDDLSPDRAGEDTEITLSGQKGEKGEGSLGPNEPPPMAWATLEELLDKLFFFAVSGDDPIFIKHFFLMYRKFATPRSVLLGMQKRIRQLNMEHSDLLLGSYAQMRICDLLEEWTEEYPTDFATPGTSGALTALVKQILSNPRTLHYGSDILPFIDELPYLQDADTSWSIKIAASREESDDDGVGPLDDEDEESTKEVALDPPAPVTTAAPLVNADSAHPKTKPPSITMRERKGSLPLSTKSILSTPLTTTLSGSSGSSPSMSGKPNLGPSSKASIKELLKTSQALAGVDAMAIAEEITRRQSELFLAIEPRQWLRYALGGSRSEESICNAATFFNVLSNWVSSLILAHDRVKVRERHVERFAEIATNLRGLNNYSGLRAVITGISNATFPNDEIMTMFSQKTGPYKKFQGWEVLLHSRRNYRAYRTAIKNTNGAGIPDMEIHTYDLVRADDANRNYKLDDPSKIHWGKFAIMARLVSTLSGFQDKIRSTGTYDYPERKGLQELLDVPVMDEDMQQSRVFPPLDDAPEPMYATASSLGLDSPNPTRPDAARFKRLFFW